MINQYISAQTLSMYRVTTTVSQGEAGVGTRVGRARGALAVGVDMDYATACGEDVSEVISIRITNVIRSPAGCPRPPAAD